MDDEKKYYCRVCDRELEVVQEDDNDTGILLYYCEHCEKLYRFVTVD